MPPTRARRASPSIVLLLAVGLVSTALAGCIGGPAPTPAGSSDERPPVRFSGPAVPEGNYTTSGNVSRVLEPGPHEIGPYVHETLESQIDAAPIRLGVQLPGTGEDEPVPVVVLASNAFADPSLEDPPDADNHRRAPFLVENYVPHGYAVAFVALRGTGDDGTCRDPFGGPEMRQDLGRALDWLATQPWSTGELATIGLSGDGVAAWAGAAQRPEHVRTVVPIGTAASGLDAFVHNGTYDPAIPLAPVATHADETPFGPDEGVLCPGVVDAVRDGLQVAATGEPGERGFWAARDLRDEILDGYDGSVFLVHGLGDGIGWPSAVDPWIDDLEDANVTTKLWLGPWGHTWPGGGTEFPPLHNPNPRWDFAEVLLHWFDRTLAGDTSVQVGPRVQVADTDAAWRSETAWPPADATDQKLHLTPEGKLADEAPSSTGRAVLGTDPTTAAPSFTTAAPADPGCPAPASPGAGCAVFATPAVDEPLRFAGRPDLELTVTPTSPRGHVTARLLLDPPDGSAREVTGGQIDLRFADGDGQPEPVSPGQALPVAWWLEPVDAVVPEGTSLVLELSQGFYQHGPAQHPIDWTVLGTTHHSSAGSTPVTVELGDGASTLTLETFTVEEAFFQPPG